MRTDLAKPEDFVNNRRWYHIDATGEVLGRMAARIAKVLQGKERPDYTPHVDTGSFVVVTNAQNVRLTGKKDTRKTYEVYSDHPDGRREISAVEMREEHPDRMVYLAVKRMLPDNRQARDMLKRLRVFEGEDHPHENQKPEEFPI
jgi:large subunit ribosomal protein L13